MALQLQPQGGSSRAWIAAAIREGAALELADLFAPPALAGKEPDAGGPEAYCRSGLTASVHGAFIDVNPASADPALRRISRDRCRESCEKALALGARNVVFHSSAFPFLRGAYLENWAGACADFYLELSEAYPLRLYIENAQDLDPQPLRMLMDRISSSRVGVCLDVGHANYSRVPVARWFDELEDRIGYLHLSDNLGSFDDHLPLGRGSIQWDRVNSCWEALGRDIPVTLETGSLEATELSLDFLREYGYFGRGGYCGG